MIRNVHDRTFAASPGRLGALIDSLAGPDDRLWPVPRWPAMRLDRGLEPGSRGGHGPVPYVVESHEPGRAVTFRFAPGLGLVGTHRFDLAEVEDGTRLRHVLEGRAEGRGRLLWPLALRWLHDALIEDSLDRAAAQLDERPWRPRRLGAWVRVCRALGRAAGASDRPAEPFVPDDASLADLVEAVRSLPYGRPSDRSVAGLLAERRGTCSTKHRYLANELAGRFPDTRPAIVHRVYRVTAEQAASRFGPGAAAAVPAEGLIDVHRYLTASVDGRRITIDATFPGSPRWDGRSPMPLACGEGDDYPAGPDPDADKRALERTHCDPSRREPFIAALGTTTVPA